MNKPILRDYQQDTVNKIYRAIKQGTRKIAVSLPTGSGKSLVIAKMASDAASVGKNTLILVHRKALVGQLESTIKAFGVEVGVIAAGHKQPKQQKPVTIAMVQTLERRELPEKVDLLILDESHITTYFDVFERCLDKYLGPIWALGKMPVVGFSATFWRTNKREGYCKFFQYKIQGISPRGLIQREYLTKPSIFTYDTLLDLNDIKVDSNGEFNLEAVRKACNEEYMADVVSKWTSSFSSLKTILFTNSVTNAKYFVKILKANGFNAALISGTTPDSTRRTLLAEFKVGIIQVLVNVGVLTEGFDEPSIECVLLARPTKSIALLVQMIGRALRLSPGKEKATIVDVCGAIQTLLDNPQPGDDCHDEEDIFEFNNFTLCSTFKPKPPKELTKQCPQCGELVNSFLAECNHCGHEFVGKEVADVPDNVSFPELIEFKTTKESKLFRILRTEVFKGFKTNVPVTVTLATFCLDNQTTVVDSWLYGAVFKGLYPEFNYQFYYYYLRELGLPASHVSRCLSLEFGDYSTKRVIDFNNWEIPSEVSNGQAIAVNWLNTQRSQSK